MLFQSFLSSSVRGNATVWLPLWKDKMFPKKIFTVGYSNVSVGEGRKKQLQELIFPAPACAEHSQHKVSLRN